MNRPPIDEIEARANAAVDGPWRACGANREKDGVCICKTVFMEEGGIIVSAHNDWLGMGDPEAKFCDLSADDRKQMADTLDFIAYSRTDIPQLIAYIRHLESQGTKP